MNRVREYIGSAAQKTILGYIQAPQNGESDEQYQKKQEKLADFHKQNRSKSGNYAPEVWQNGKSKDITFDSLNDLLRIAEIDGRKLFDLLGVSAPYAEPEYETVIELCNKLPDGTLLQILQKADALTVDWWKQSDVKKMQPSTRALTVFRRRVPRSSRNADKPAALAHAWDDQHGRTTIPIEAMPEVCAFLRVSPHWLLRMDDDIPFYADRALIDRLLDRYSFLPTYCKPDFIELLQDYADREGL